MSHARTAQSAYVPAMEKEQSQTLLTQGLDASPSPPATTNRTQLFASRGQSRTNTQTLTKRDAGTSDAAPTPQQPITETSLLSKRFRSDREVNEAVNPQSSVEDGTSLSYHNKGGALSFEPAHRAKLLPGNAGSSKKPVITAHNFQDRKVNADYKSFPNPDHTFKKPENLTRTNHRLNQTIAGFSFGNTNHRNKSKIGSKSLSVPNDLSNRFFISGKHDTSFSSERSALSLPKFRTASSLLQKSTTESTYKSYAQEAGSQNQSCLSRSIRDLGDSQACLSRSMRAPSDLSSVMIPAARSSVLNAAASVLTDSLTSAESSPQNYAITLRADLPTRGHCDVSANPGNENSQLLSTSFRSESLRGGTNADLSAEGRLRPVPTSSTQTNNRASVEMEGDGEISKTIVCVIWQKGLLGACIYNTDTMKLQLVQDFPEGAGFQLTEQLIMQTRPDIVLTSSRQDGRFLEALKALVNNERSEEGETNNRGLQTITSNDLGYELSRQRLRLACENSLAKGKADKESFISSTVNTSYVNMVRASGGLLRYLETNSVTLFVNNNCDSEVPVLAVELYFMQSQVWMDANTYSSLRIMHLGDHPSAALGGSYSREGFSLYGLMDRCKTSIGKKKLKEWFLRPSRDLEQLNDRLDCLEYFAPARNTEVTQLIKSNLSKLRNMTRIVSRMRNAGLAYADWLAMHRVFQSLIIIAEICTQHKDDLSIFSKFPTFRKSIQSAGQILFGILDVEQTKLTKSFTIKTNYDPEMDKLVQRCRDLPELLGQKLTPHVRLVKQIVRSAVHIHYSSQLGCLLMVDITSRMEKSGDYNIDGLNLEFLTEKNAYYSSPYTREISEECGDVKTAITDRALTLMYQLQNTLLPEMDSMLEALDICSELDCLIGLSSFCAAQNYVRPELHGNNKLDIKGSRHALLEAQVDNFIANDISSGGENKARMMIITGPNACGKSIYLKQTVLIVYLAHIGCMVPADSASIGLVDAIFTHFPINDSINSNVSTFTADLRRMAAILNNATNKSLVVLDEFGKGTCPVNGAALLLSILRFWLKTGGDTCPHVLVASHFHTICRSSWVRNSPIACMKMMETHIEDGKMTCLYELVDGAAGSSHASSIAQLLQISVDESLPNRRREQRAQLEKARQRERKDRMISNAAKEMMSLDLEDEDRAIQLLDSISDEQ